MSTKKKHITNEIMQKMSYIGAVVLFIAILPLPSIYYLLLRQVITFIALYFVFRFYTNKLHTQAIASLGIAILFNPFIPVYLDKSLWIVLDVLVAAALLFLGTRQTAKITKPDEVQAFFFIYLIGFFTMYSLVNMIYDPCDKLTGEAKQQCEARQDYDDYMESKDVFYP